MAVIEKGLPSLPLDDVHVDSPLRVQKMAQFAKDVANWLRAFAGGIVRHKSTPQYKAAYQYSRLDIPKAQRGVKPRPNEMQEGFHCA